MLFVFNVGVLLDSFVTRVHASTNITPKTVIYVEVNDNDFNNVGKYTLEGTARPAFDMGMIFAANINYDTTNKKPYLFLNDRASQTLNDYKTQILPVQAKGTKVLLTILGKVLLRSFLISCIYCKM